MSQIALSKEWLRLRDVANRGDVSLAWVRQLVQRGLLVAEKTRLGWLVEPGSVETWMASRETRNP